MWTCDRFGMKITFEWLHICKRPSSGHNRNSLKKKTFFWQNKIYIFFIGQNRPFIWFRCIVVHTKTYIHLLRLSFEIVIRTIVYQIKREQENIVIIKKYGSYLETKQINNKTNICDIVKNIYIFFFRSIRKTLKSI